MINLEWLFNIKILNCNQFFFPLLRPLFISFPPVLKPVFVKLVKFSLILTFGFSPLNPELIEAVKGISPKSLEMVLDGGPISSEGCGRLSFFFELGRILISGKNNYPVLSITEVFDDVTFCTLGRSEVLSAEFFLFNLLRSNPPPVCNYFRFLLSSSTFKRSSSCFFMCSLRASSALFYVSFLRSSSSLSFWSFSSSSLCLSISARFLRYSSFSFLYSLTFSSNSLSCSEVSMFSSSEQISLSSTKT